MAERGKFGVTLLNAVLLTMLFVAHQRKAAFGVQESGSGLEMNCNIGKMVASVFTSVPDRLFAQFRLEVCCLGIARQMHMGHCIIWLSVKCQTLPDRRLRDSLPSPACNAASCPIHTHLD